MAEKTEKASPKKLRDARAKGQVAKSQDFPSAFTFITALSFTLIFSESIYNQFSNYILGIFKLIPMLQGPGATGITLPSQIGSIFIESMYVMMNTSVPIAGITAFIGCAITFLIVGPVFTVEVFKFDIKKFNPITNLGQKFKMKTLVELLKSIAKISIAAILIYTAIWGSLDEIVATAAIPLYNTVLVYNAFLMKVMIRVGIFFIFVAVFDLVYQQSVFAKEMKMEKHEVKQEYKESEGNPEIKGKRKQIAQEIAYSEGPSAVKRSQVVVTNPEHLAIALAYDPKKVKAPYVVFKGAEGLAQRMIAEAEKYGIPVMRNIPLARRLYETTEINKFIPEDTYEAVAELLRYVASLKDEE